MDAIPAIRDFMAKELLQCGELEVAVDLPLIDEGYLTSLQTVELVMFLEQQFQIEIDPTEVDEENFRSLSTIAALVGRKQG